MNNVQIDNVKKAEYVIGNMLERILKLGAEKQSLLRRIEECTKSNSPFDICFIPQLSAELNNVCVRLDELERLAKSFEICVKVGED